MVQVTKLCARCKEASRDSSHKSYCRPCHRALARESRARIGGKKPQVNCSRCGTKRDGRHPSFCNACNKLYKLERLLEPCAKCGTPRDGTDKAHTLYCATCWRSWWMERKYGLSSEQFDELLALQGNKCAICRSEHNGRQWHVDHCHITGRVRGILCDNCNRGIGHLKDSPVLARIAAQYLEAGGYRAVAALTEDSNGFAWFG